VANEVDPQVTYAMRDDVLTWGPVLLLGASYRRALPAFADVFGRLAGGLFVARSVDRMSGTASGYGESVAVDFTGERVVTKPTWLLVPELGVVKQLGRLDIAVSLAAGILPEDGPSLQNGLAVQGKTSNCEMGTVTCSGSSAQFADERAYGASVFFFPSVSLAYKLK
jgi:hypothetical protein